jgi:hypothetical protein
MAKTGSFILWLKSFMTVRSEPVPTPFIGLIITARSAGPNRTSRSSNAVALLRSWVVAGKSINEQY